MQSLRTRRSQAPRRGPNSRNPDQSSSKLVKPGSGPTPRPRDARKSRVDDKIKKRMSMRYANISGPTQLDPVPSMPSLPSSLVTGGNRGVGSELEEDVRDRRISVRVGAKAEGDDKLLLDKEDFDPDAFLKLKLANSTEAELKYLQSSLHAAKGDTASELQRNVFKNYAEFVLISKEISVLENEMLQLKDSLSDYKAMPSLLHIPEPTALSSSTLSTYKRSSVADLRVLYHNQMQALHAQIEGSAKFAPTTPGRHVVGEVEGVFALNSATYKVAGKVKFVVLDDAVLVARRRRRGAGNAAGDGHSGNPSEGKLVAERCWPLSEMLVLDTKDSPSMTNVFKIRQGKETHVYRTETASDKKALLAQFRQVAEELAAKKRKEREGEHERRKSMWQSSGGDRSSIALSQLPSVPDWMAELAQRANESISSGSVDAKEKAERDARWVGEWADELTVAIALREWEKGVTLIEQGTEKLSTTPLLAPKLPPLTLTLTTSLITALSHPNNRKSTVVSLISLLLRLKAGAAARSAFLQMRADVMRSHVRRIRFEGHVGAYVGEMAIVWFTGIKHTADWFLASFKENEVASAFIDWAKKQIEHYAEMFRIQVYTSDVDPRVVEEAIKITYAQSKKLLQEYGLDFRFLLDELLLEKPKDEVLNPTPAASFHRPLMPKHESRVIPIKSTPSPSLTASSHTTAASSASANNAMTGSTSNAASTSTTVRNRSPLPSPALPSPVPPPSSFFASMTSLASSTSSLPQRQPTPPVVAPTPRRMNTRTPPPAFTSRSYSPLPESPSRAGATSAVAGQRERPPRAARGSPAPPPRSMNRPGSALGVGVGAGGYGSLRDRERGGAPPPAVPQREGMI